MFNEYVRRCEISKTREGRHRVEITLCNKDFERLSKEAESIGLKLAPYIRTLIVGDRQTVSIPVLNASNSSKGIESKKGTSGGIHQVDINDIFNRDVK